MEICNELYNIGDYIKCNCSPSCIVAGKVENISNDYYVLDARSLFTQILLSRAELITDKYEIHKLKIKRSQNDY